MLKSRGFVCRSEASWLTHMSVILFRAPGFPAHVKYSVEFAFGLNKRSLTGPVIVKDFAITCVLGRFGSLGMD